MVLEVESHVSNQSWNCPCQVARTMERHIGALPGRSQTAECAFGQAANPGKKTVRQGAADIPVAFFDESLVCKRQLSAELLPTAPTSLSSLVAPATHFSHVGGTSGLGAADIAASAAPGGETSVDTLRRSGLEPARNARRAFPGLYEALAMISQ